MNNKSKLNTVSNYSVSSRIKFLFLIFSLSVIAIFFRLFQLQIIQGEKYKAIAKSQHESNFIISASRGLIYSSDGFPLANNKMSYLLYAEPKMITSASEVASVLSAVLSKNTADLENLLNEDLSWVILEKRVDEETKNKIESLSLQGIGFEEISERFYSENDFARHVLGFVGSSEAGEDQGYYGLEGYYNNDLKGRDGRMLQEYGALGDPILTGNYNKIPPLNGRNITLTINRDIQYLVEKHLKQGVEKYRALSGTAVVIDPQSGAILAMADAPSQASPSAFLNRAISETFEPGSVMKAVTLAAAINEGIVEPETTMMDEGPVVYSGHTVNNWDGKHHGEETMVEILQHSNNIGAAWVGEKLGAKKLREYFLEFGFGVLTGIDLEGESTGIIRDLKEWYDIDLAAASFGQGISVTPLQMVSSLATIANRGEYKRPYLVSKINDPVNKDDSFEISQSPVSKRVLKEDKAEIMVEMLTQAVSGGEGKFAVLEDYKVAGKTGTAQIPIEGRYDPTKTNATFMGFLPNSRKFAMLIKLEQPASSNWASETAEPLWMEIASDLAHYYGTKPDF